ncbi:hypothetical protein J5N97_017128 [Dioscorea zingiberensis]|uniref:Uncharacterized protein n=1 Tax=Dioscorea zingiberensis TaxID=325984 RepID=A0A9D5CKP1_9LILI|nr:hypothetical protein J5N97_017128 [Dioscorea zingiberensis]
MMASLLKKFCRSKIFYSCSQNHIFGCSFCFSTSITQSKTTPKPQSLVVEYLLSTFDFSPEKAVWASKNLNHLKSFEKPESVLNFLKGYGFDDTQIKKLVSLYPQSLCCDVERTLKPKFEGLQGLGFTGPELAHLILSNHMVLRSSFERNVRPKIEFLARDPWSKTTLEPQSIVEEFLLSTLGLSPEKATWAAEQLNHLKSLEKPESVLNCLKSYGFEDTQIKKLVSWYPRWLCFDVETTLKPKFEGLQGLGFSGPELIQLILTNPVILRSSFDRSVRPKMEFWREILGSFELMSKSLRAKQCLLNFSLNQRVLPNLAFLREFGIPDERISFIVQRHPRIISQKPEGMKELAGGLKEWGYLVAQRCLCGLLTLFGSSPKTNLMANWEL